MNKSMAVLAFVMVGHFSLAHATHSIKSVAIADEADVQKNSSMLTDNPSQFEDVVRTNRDLLTHVDFSGVVDETTPFFIKSTVDEHPYAVGVFGSGHGAQAVTSMNGLPATYWFGDQAESTFVFANGSVQIVFPQDVYAASLMINAIAHNQELQLELETITDVKAGTMLIDANGNMIGESSINLTTRGPAFLGALSDIPFRSVILTSTSSNWLFSDLNYVADGQILSGAGLETPAEKYDLPCTGVEGVCMSTEN